MPSDYDVQFLTDKYSMNRTHFNIKYQYMITICDAKPTTIIINHTIHFQTTQSFIKYNINHETSISATWSLFSATRSSSNPHDRAIVNQSAIIKQINHTIKPINYTFGIKQLRVQMVTILHQKSNFCRKFISRIIARSWFSKEKSV